MEPALFEECLLPPEFVTAKGDAPRRKPAGVSPDAPSHRSTRVSPSLPDLSARAVAILTASRGRKRPAAGGPHRDDAGLDRVEPARLLRAAGRLSRQELLGRPQVGPCVVAEIDAWLTAHGRRFRPDPAPLSDALGEALDHIEAMLDGNDDDAFLSALVALPELRRSLAASAGRSRRRRQGKSRVTA